MAIPLFTAAYAAARRAIDETNKLVKLGRYDNGPRYRICIYQLYTCETTSKNFREASCRVSLRGSGISRLPLSGSSKARVTTEDIQIPITTFRYFCLGNTYSLPPPEHCTSRGKAWCYGGTPIMYKMVGPDRHAPLLLAPNSCGTLLASTCGLKAAARSAKQGPG